MNNYTKDDIIRIAEEKNINFIRLQFTDIAGRLKNVAITRSQLRRILDHNCMFDGSSIEGFVRIEESDMYLVPDIDTFTVYPWSKRPTARLICDVYRPDGQPFDGDPRYVLKRMLKKASDMGYDFNIGPECEFFLFEKDENGFPTTITRDKGSYFELGPTDLGEEARSDICVALEEMGYTVEASHHEVGNGQHEIDFKYGDALKAADDIQTFKLAVKSIADRHGLYATFMPKPLYGEAGSGMHINMSLSRDGKNIFADENDEKGLSKEAYSFIAGLIDHCKGMTAITNPLVNSYKRLTNGYEAPVYIAWSAQNRSPLIRIPAARGSGTRIELRNPDPCANPYLVLAVCLAAGLDGMERKLTPPPEVHSNIFKMTEEELEELGIERIPYSLKNAIRELRKDELIKATLGDHILTKYIRHKNHEWDAYSMSVSSWEIDNYLAKY